MSIATVVTRGYASGGSIPFVSRRGYGSGGVVEGRRGGAFYPTQEELRELRRRRKVIEDRQREADAAIDATIREAYQDAVHPEIKAAKLAEAKAEQERIRVDLQDLDDMHTVLTMYLEYQRKLH